MDEIHIRWTKCYKKVEKADEKFSVKSAKMCKKFKSCKESNEKFRRTKYNTLKETFKKRKADKFYEWIVTFC
jgi:hypothetical protein